MAQVTQYEPNVLQVFIEDRYEQARMIVRQCAALYGVIGAVLCAIGGGALSRGDGSAMATRLVVGAVIGAMIGVSVGKRKAWEYKFEAQKLLLQMQIEKNTRTTSIGA